MSWVGLAAARKSAAEECLKAEFKVAHAQDALHGAFAGVVQNLPFLGYTRHAETAGL